MNYLGIDIGCTAIKFGEVQIHPEIETVGFDMLVMPQSMRTEKYSEALVNLTQNAKNVAAIGIGFPSVVWEDGIMNLEIRFDDIWKRIQQTLAESKIPLFAINDADAAGFAEIYHPQAQDLRKGVSIVLTLGTGIGSGVFLDGKLLPNSELGMIEIHQMMAEAYAAASVIRRDNLSIQSWAGRLQEVINQIEIILSPDHILIGGGISSDFEQYRSFLSTKRANLAPARYRNQAGVIGAGLYAAYRSQGHTLNTGAD